MQTMLGPEGFQSGIQIVKVNLKRLGPPDPVRDARGGHQQVPRLHRQLATVEEEPPFSLDDLVHLVHPLMRVQGVRYEERGPDVSRARTQRRAAKMIRELRSLGYRVEFGPSPLVAV